MFFLLVLFFVFLLFFLLTKKNITFDNCFKKGVIGNDVEKYINLSESNNKNILPWAKKRIFWYNSKSKTKTRIAIIYIHGFSASMGEIRPVPDILAKNLKANLFFTRLSGHGLYDKYSLKDVDGKNWYNDIQEAFEIGNKIGEKILVVATSFGCTLVTEYLSKTDKNNSVLGSVFISPCFGISDWRLFFGKYIWSKSLFKLFFGDQRVISNRNPEEKKWWCNTYPVESIVNLVISVEKIWKSDFRKISSPALFIYSPKDKWISISRLKKATKIWGNDVSLVALDIKSNVDNGNFHVILGNLKAPSETNLGLEIINSWLINLLKS
ncbi:MAG: alpha/beta hydrolase [Paracoccaceae bacterium]